MGFPKEKAIYALKLKNGNTDNALDYLCSHPDEIVPENLDNEKDDKKDDEEEEINKGNNSIYDIYAYFTHLGKNPDHGHYVCHIREAGNKWIYFNDNKVNEWENPPIYKGNVYFYKAK